MKQIQMVDLVNQYKKIQEEMDSAILEIVRSGQYINGQIVRDFMDKLAGYTGARYAIPCANGTDALQISLMALDLQPGDEVIVPSFTYAAAAESVALLNLIPVAVDVDKDTFNIDTNKIEEAISPKTKAIIPVHLYGQTCNMEPIMKIAKENNLYVIEDNAQSVGSIYTFSDNTQKQAGCIGHIGTLSFFPTKNLSCYGDGGAMLTNDEVLAKRLKMIALHGQSEKYRHEIIGCNSRLDNIQAAVLNVKLKYLDEYNKIRQQTAKRYDELLSTFTGKLETPYCIPSSTHVYHQYTIKIKNNKRNDFKEYLNKSDIPSMIYYHIPLHQQPAFKDIIRIGGDLSVSENLCQTVLSLPMHTELEEEQLVYIADQIKKYE